MIHSTLIHAAPLASWSLVCCRGPVFFRSASVYKSPGLCPFLTDHIFEMSSASYTAKDVKRMRESRMVFIDWGDNNDVSLADLFAASKRFRAQVLEHNMPAWLFDLTDELERDILALESIVAMFPGAY
jgi:hypothetical protein